MSLKYTSGKVGQITYLGKKVIVWKYTDGKALRAEFENLGRYLDEDSIAWVGQEFLIYGSKIVGKTTYSGNITWLDKPVELPMDMKPWEPSVPEKVIGKRREISRVEDYCEEVDAKALWASAIRTDWEAIMVKTSW